MGRKNLLPYLFVVICTAIYVSLIFNENVWMDEAFSASIIRCGFGEMINRTIADTLPPFYNVSAWLFTNTFGFSTITLKIFSIVPMTLLMIVSAHFVPKIASIRASCLYIVLITAMPHFLEHGVEIRMYSWAVFFASATAVFALCYIRSVPHSAIYLMISTVLGAYTHQYALIAEAFVWLMLLVVSIRERAVKIWCRYAVICVVCYAPCAVLTVRQMKAATAYFSASPATLDSLLSSARYPFVTNITILSALLLVFSVLLLWYAGTKKEFSYGYYFMIFAFVSLMSFGIMVVTDSTFFTSRYLMPAIGILWLGAALALDRLISENKYILFVTIPLVAAVFLTIYIQQFRSEYIDMSAFKSFLDSTEEGDGYVVYEEFPEIEICMEYYAPWMKSCNIDEIGNIEGKKYVLVNRDMHTDDIEQIKMKNYSLRYVENLTFDRYTIRAYELTGN